jgi:DNA polymerase (family X)
MTNKEIAKNFTFLADLMELHKENSFKIRTYQNAYITLRKLDTPLAEMPEQAIAELKGVGKAVAEKIKELVETGKMSTLEKYKDMTPVGVQDMLQIKGFGPKKIFSIWKDLEIDNVGELYYACIENRLIQLHGFGLKTQEDLKAKIEYFQKSRNKFRFGDVEKEANSIFEALKTAFPKAKIEFTGAYRRLDPIIERIEFIFSDEKNIQDFFDGVKYIFNKSIENASLGVTEDGLPFTIFEVAADEFGSKQFRYSSTKGFIERFLKEAKATDFKGISTEEAVFEKAQIPYVLPELREDIYEDISKISNIDLIQFADIKGVVHTHSTWSDGLNSIADMADASQKAGYEYLVMSDHSQAAFYANGLNTERFLAQMKEIDELNAKNPSFKIFKSIECDILYDGRLDMTEDLLKKFDLVIASVHSQLKMDETKATERLIKAIENPLTSILGHPTGRLLLSRAGYPIDHKKVIDACAANQVVLELNASPYRLDLDWTWIPYALEKNVMISINPDAHSREGIKDIHFGVLAARKGSLSKEMCLNTLSAADFLAKLKKK